MAVLRIDSRESIAIVMSKKKLKLQEASENVTQDIIKDSIKSLVFFIVKLVWNVYGVSILAGLTLLLLGLAKLLNIPIILPAYLFGAIFIIAIVGTLALKKGVESLRRRKKTILYEGLSWRPSQNEGDIVPSCPSCKTVIPILGNDIEKQLQNAANIIFGNEPEYIYQCQECGYKTKSKLSPIELIQNAKMAFIGNNRDRDNQHST